MELAEQTQKTYVFANNHSRGQAAANALQLSSKIRHQKVPVPELLIEKYPFLKDIAEAEEKQGELF